MTWLMIGLMLVPTPAYAQQSVDQLQGRQQQIQQQLNTTRGRIRALQQQENSARSTLSGVRSRLDTTQSQINDTQFRLQRAEESLVAMEKELTQLQDRLQTQRKQATSRLRFLQQQGTQQWWTLLLGSQHLNDFFDRRHQLFRLIAADRTLIANLQETAKKVEQQRRVLEERKNEIALLGQQLTGQRQQLEQQAVIQQGLVNRIAGERAAYEAAQRRLESDSRQLTQLIRQLIAQQTRGADPVQGRGRMMAPVAGRVSSVFGWRVHPVYRTRRFHSGIDFAVASGTPVAAANNGTVIFAGWYGGYGNTVIINHGGGITTLYAHNSSVLVAPGQTVRRGQAIARSGSTGLSTGPHVHFEVRVKGQPVNPGGYL
ncbi:MAG: M23 family metallopeptidase [Synechococcales cyanobacterium]